MEKRLNSKIITIIFIVIVIFLVSWGINKYLNLKTDLRVAQQNESALKDSIRVTKNKVGDLEYSKQILVAKNANDLKRLNGELADLAKDFTGKIHELSNVVAKIKNNTIITNNTTMVNLPDNTSGFKWEYSKIFDSENSRNLAGITKFKYDSINNFITPLETVITTDEINFNLTQGLRTTKDGKIEMFASSRYPNFSAIDINSVIIDPSTHPVLKKFTKQRKLHLSVYGGYGATADFKNNTVILGPQIGGGISYTLW